MAPLRGPHSTQECHHMLVINVLLNGEVPELKEEMHPDQEPKEVKGIIRAGPQELAPAAL